MHRWTTCALWFWYICIYHFFQPGHPRSWGQTPSWLYALHSHSLLQALNCKTISGHQIPRANPSSHVLQSFVYPIHSTHSVHHISHLPHQSSKKNNQGGRAVFRYLQHQRHQLSTGGLSTINTCRVNKNETRVFPTQTMQSCKWQMVS